MVTAFWGPAYPTGSGVYTCEISDRLSKMGHEVHVFTSEFGDTNNNGCSPGMQLHYLKNHGLLWGMNPLSNPFFKLIEEDFDIVHIHSYVFLMSNEAALARSLRNFSCILQFHGGLNTQGMQISKNRLWIKNNLFDRTIGLFTVRRADKVLSIAMADMPIIKKKFGVDAEYLPNAVDTKKFSKGETEGDCITYVGKFESWKGFESVLNIFKIVHDRRPETKFLLVGAGSLEDMVSKVDLPIEVIRHVPHSEMPKIYHRTAVALLPSYMEGSPTFCIESLACEVPIVASDVGDTKLIVKDGENGYVEKAGDEEAMAARIVGLISDPELRRKMGRAGREHIEKNFSYDTVIESLIKIYEDSLKGKKRVG
jgi:glycosyltransferase involved in cell wall biosynthesis